jgi:DNA-binding XRE family transcriptional regulator
MASFAAMLKEEITRLSRKEAKKLVEPVRKASAGYRHDIAALKREVAGLQRDLAALGRVTKKTVAAAPAVDETKPTRFVSQNDFGTLAGVSGQSIYNWERGFSVPRKAQLATLASLRPLGKREAQERLAQVKKKAPKKVAKKVRKSKKAAKA